MKKYILIISMFSQSLFSQDVIQEPARDIFLDYVVRMSPSMMLEYEAENRQKALFETDTVLSRARVVFRKHKDSIDFIHILGLDRQDEFLFLNDTGWYFIPGKMEWQMTGVRLDSIRGGGLMSFLPVNMFTIRYSGHIPQPFWHVTGKEENFSVVKMEIKDRPAELTRLDVILKIGNDDHLLYQMIMDSYFEAYHDNIYRELILSNYRFHAPDSNLIPESFRVHPKVFRSNAAQLPSTDLSASDEKYLDNLHLVDLSGNEFPLPDKGLIFMDLWYAGCFPCLKSSPVVESMWEKYHEKVLFLSINEVDTDTAKIIRFMHSLKLSFPVLLNRYERISIQTTGHGSYPVFILLDAESRKILWYLNGYNENMDNEIDAAISLHIK